MVLARSCFDSNLFLRVKCVAPRGIVHILLKALLCMGPEMLAVGSLPHRGFPPSEGSLALPLLSSTLDIKAASILSRRDSIPGTASLQGCIYRKFDLFLSVKCRAHCRLTCIPLKALRCLRPHMYVVEAISTGCSSK